MAYATRSYKLGLAPDSISYLSMAKHMAAGRGAAVYMSNLSTKSESISAWPPLYPFVLMLWHANGAAFYDGTWTLNLLILGLNIFLVGFLVCNVLNSEAAGLVTALLFALDPRTQSYHAWALSEPLSICWVHLSLLFLIFYLKNKHVVFFVLSAVFLSLAPVTRYVSALYIPVIAVLFLFLNEKNLPERLRKAFVYGILASIPTLFWIGRNYSVTRRQNWSAAKNMFGSLIHDPSQAVPLAKNLHKSFTLIGDWLAEYSKLPANAAVFFVLLSVVYFTYEYRKIPNSVIKIFGAACALLVVVYVIGLNCILRWSFFQFEMPDRYVYPIYEFILMLVVMAVYLFLQRTPKPFLARLLLAAILITGVLLHLQDLWAWSGSLQKSGIDESRGRRWQFVQKIKWLPDSNP